MSFTAKSYAGGAGATDVATTFNNSASSCTVRTSLSSLNWTETSGANAGQPLGTSGPFVVVFDFALATEEKILCSSITGTAPNDITLNFTTRGYDGTAAASHSAATNQGLVFPVASSVDLYEANQAAVQTVGKVTTKGDILVATGANTFARLPVGGNGLALVADSTQTTGLKYGTLSGLGAPIGESTSFNAAANSIYELSAQCTATLPTPTAGVQVAFVVVYAATGSSASTVLASSGGVNGPGIGSGSTSFILGSLGAYAVLEADGTNWVMIAGAQDSGWINVSSLSNSWTTTNGFGYRLIGNRVHMRGAMTGGASGSSPLTLPAGYRPAANSTDSPVVSLTSFNATPAPVAASAVIVGAGNPSPGQMTVYYASGGLSANFYGTSFTVD